MLLKAAATTTHSDLLALLFVLASILLAAKLTGALAIRLGQPAVLGELLAGLVLGPTVIDFLALPILGGGEVGDAIRHFAEIGVLCLMFGAGLETELSDLRQAGRPALLGGVLGVISPAVLGTGVGLAFGQSLQEAIFLGITLSATSVSISAQTLLELGYLRTREGVALLGAAVIDDILVIMILSTFVLVVSGTGSLTLVLLQLARMILVIVLSLAAALLLLPRVADWSLRLRVSEALLATSLAILLLFAWVADFFGSVAAITGAFIAGLGLRRSSHREEIEVGLHKISYGFFVPIFLVNIGLQANVKDLDIHGIFMATVIVLIAVISKVIGSGLGARWGGFDSPAAFRMGLGMISRGEVGLIVVGIGMAEGIISSEQFSIVVLMVLVSTLITPILLRWAYSKVEM